MAKIKSKGTVLAVSISAVYTAIPQLKSISISGAASETYDSTTLDGTVYKTKDPTGYTEPATISADLFRDPDNTTHQALIALLAAPVATNFKVTYADATPLEEVYSGVGFGWDTTVAPADGLSSTLTVVTSGAPS
jgi:hypothetical protein